jgi:hypothetical protein
MLCWGSWDARTGLRHRGAVAIRAPFVYCPLLMLSLLRRWISQLLPARESDPTKGGRWVEPSSEVTRAVLDPSAKATPIEQTLYESIKARFPIPARGARRAVAQQQRQAPVSQPARAAQEQIAPEEGKKSKSGRAA